MDVQLLLPQSCTPAVDLRTSDIHTALYIKWCRTSAPAVPHSRSVKKKNSYWCRTLAPAVPQSRSGFLFRFVMQIRLSTAGLWEQHQDAYQSGRVF